MKSSTSIWRYVVNFKSTVKILSIFVAFLENVNFTQGCIYFGKIWSVWQINDSLYVYELCNIWTIKYFYHGLEMGEE